VAQTMCSLELKCPRAAVLSEIRISAIAYYVNVAGNRYEPRRVPVDIVVAPSCNCATQKDSALCMSRWSGNSQVGEGEAFFITFTIEERDTCLRGSCHIEMRDITLKMKAVATTLGSQLAKLFNNQAMLPPGDAVSVRLADSGAPPLHVSRFVLQLRSPVFRAEFSSDFHEASSRELSFNDFPPAAVTCFLEMLHADEYTGPRLSAEDIVALFALGDKYDVSFVQEYVVNELSTRVFEPEELSVAFVATSRHHACALRTMLVKRLRWLPEEELCAFLDAAAPNACLADCTR